MSTSDDYKMSMYKFINSTNFVNKKVSLVDNKYYKDNSTGIVYAVVVRSLNNLPTFSNPVIYLSNNPFILKRLTDTYNTKHWNCDRLNDMGGEEFDFICLRQRNILNLKSR